MENKEKLENRNWLFDVVKGIFIGSGFIVPGVSGGALAAIFGIYEPLINFLANITDNFWKNIKYFLPIGIGGIIGVILFSWIVSFALGNYETYVLWAFVGTIFGMMPALWKEAGEQGRDKVDMTIMVVSFILGFILLAFGNYFIDGQVAPSFIAWMVCGALISLGMLIPGLSPSNFIVYMGLYKDMSDAFARLDFSVIIPIAIGAVITIFALAKVIEKIFENYYSKFYHFIFGIVLASTVMIIPTDYSGFGFMDYVWCLIAFVLGAALGHWMSQLEEKYK